MSIVDDIPTFVRLTPEITGAIPVYEETGKKFDSGKPRMDLLPMDALLEVAKVLAFGAKKYGDRNWEKGLDVQRLRAAQLRHDAATEMGQAIDEESGLSHTAHKVTDALMELALRLRAK